MATGILKFFKPDTNSDFPDPNGFLSTDIPSKAIAAANNELQVLRETYSTTRKRHGSYNTYTPKERADIARYTIQHGATAASRKFSKMLRKDLHESTVRGFKKMYQEELAKRREAGEIDVCVKKLPTKKQGRPVVLGERLDSMVQSCVIFERKRLCY